MKQYQIRNLDSDGCGSYYYVKVTENATDDQICDLIADHLTEKKERHDSIKFFGWRPLFTNRQMKIVEIHDAKGGKTVRGGRKGKAWLSHVYFKGVNMLTDRKFTRSHSSFQVELTK